MQKDTHSITRAWLGLSVVALGLSGLFSLLVILPRTPIIQSLIPIQDFFYTALVLHVDLSVLIWMLSLTALLLHHYLPSRYPFVTRFALILGYGSMLLFAASPFLGDNLPLMNNYVPVLQNPVFFLALSCFFIAITLQCGASLLTSPFPRDPLSFAVFTCGLLWMAVCAAWMMAGKALHHPSLTPILTAELYYEHLFWGGGHILQFLYTQLMGIAWVRLLASRGMTLSPRLVYLLFALNALLGMGALLIYAWEPVVMHGYGDYFTMHMRYAGGIVPIGWTILICLSLRHTPLQSKNWALSFLIASLLLFHLGGTLGYLIFGHNVVIPAHYHGSIVGVTLSLMGLAYLYVEELGLNRHAILRPWARRLPWIYGGGQALHITGLAWSGGYGALRKTPGAVLSSKGQAAMGLMGLGGLIAIIGGLLFVVVMIRAFRNDH